MDITARQKVIKEMENRGYSVTDESGVLMFLGKFDRIDESMADIKKNLESLDFQGSWGTRGYPKGYKPSARPVEKVVEKVVEESDKSSDENSDEGLGEGFNDGPAEESVVQSTSSALSEDDSDSFIPDADPDSFTQLSFDGLF